MTKAVIYTSIKGSHPDDKPPSAIQWVLAAEVEEQLRACFTLQTYAAVGSSGVGNIAFYACVIAQAPSKIILLTADYFSSENCCLELLMAIHNWRPSTALLVMIPMSESATADDSVRDFFVLLTAFESNRVEKFIERLFEADVIAKWPPKMKSAWSKLQTSDDPSMNGFDTENEISLFASTAAIIKELEGTTNVDSVYRYCEDPNSTAPNSTAQAEIIAKRCEQLFTWHYDNSIGEIEQIVQSPKIGVLRAPKYKAAMDVLELEFNLSWEEFLTNKSSVQASKAVKIIPALESINAMIGTSDDHFGNKVHFSQALELFISAYFETLFPQKWLSFLNNFPSQIKGYCGDENQYINLAALLRAQKGQLARLDINPIVIKFAQSSDPEAEANQALSRLSTCIDALLMPGRAPKRELLVRLEALNQSPVVILHLDFGMGADLKSALAFIKKLEGSSEYKNLLLVGIVPVSHNNPVGHAIPLLDSGKIPVSDQLATIAISLDGIKSGLNLRK